MLDLEGFSIVALEPGADTYLNNPLRGELQYLSFTTAAQGGFKECAFTLTGLALHMLEWFYLLGKRIQVYGPSGQIAWEGIIAQLDYSHGITYDLSTVNNGVLCQWSNDLLSDQETSWATDSDSQGRYGKKEIVVQMNGVSQTTAERYRDLVLYFTLRSLGANPFYVPQPPPPKELKLQVTAWGLYSTLAWERWQDTTQGDVDTGTQIISICAGRSGSGNGYIDTSNISTTGVSESRYRPDQYMSLQGEIERLATMGDVSDNPLWFQVWENREATLDTWGGADGNFPNPDYYQDARFVYDANGMKIPKWLVRADKVISTPGFQPLGYGWEADALEEPKNVYILETRYTIPGDELQITPAGWREWAQMIGRVGLTTTRQMGGFIDPIVTDPYLPRDGFAKSRGPSSKMPGKSANYTLGQEAGVNATAGAGGITITLPPAADATYREYTIKKVDAGAGAVTVDGDGGETIDGVANQMLNNQYDCITVRSNGSTWFILADNR